MEFRRNIIFSVIAHVSLLVMMSALVGTNAGLARLPQNYVAVSLLEDVNEKKSVPAETPERTNHRYSSKPDTNSQKIPGPDGDRWKASHRDENTTAPQVRKDEPLIGKNAKEALNPDSNPGQIPAKTQEQQVPLRDVLPGLGYSGDNRRNASPPSAKAGAHGSSFEVRMIEPRSSGGTNPLSDLDRIKVAIERAKVYPVMARKRGQEGVVIAGFSINEKGLAEKIRIVKSSGYDLLDAAATDTIIKAAPFPAVKGSMEVPIRFSLK